MCIRDRNLSHRFCKSFGYQRFFHLSKVSASPVNPVSYTHLTAVESCSKKLPLFSAALVCGYTGLLHQYSDCGGVFCPLFTTTTVKKVRFGKCSGNFFDFPVLLPTTIRRCGLPKIFENRRKKSSKPFSRFTAYMPL